jgi:S1-C subfamily serine protease
VTLGIIPDYAEGTEGMKIGGIRPNGPAEKAGLKAGDVITKMAGKKVLNIYDYMGLLGELKAGDVVEIEALRGGAIVTLKATMEKRK